QHIHRLDRPVCGLVLFAKQREALKPLSEMMAERRVQKFYRAYTAHAPEQKEASLLHWHRKEKKKACIVPEGTAYAERVQLDYRVSQRGRYFFWEIQLHTGKFHQIRAQLSHIGCPILGDTFYGSSLVLAEPAIALQAYRLVFQHPITGQAMDLHSRMELNTGNFPLD
ncbi:MAG: pseudouridine synthase, partial [Cytophagaceae bacterium]|nr:pseudouridine synthase [Cytophagaceae bacterium]